ncbi:hypothetical protein PIB30_078699 [Stylosanthes scabra]|uniref:Putative plant transposon protein domain-containing protein n=1 Tax=Stylosanthes scabra TaxID=79078 RepID=A0ABU6URQ8_9FABA|nr:hypothetical protein [Stylosanthes scabra]
MAHKGKEVAYASTPSRSRTTKNSNRGRDNSFPTECFDSQIHYDRWKTMEHRRITYEWIIRFLDREPDFMLERIEGLGWGFMYNAFPTINITMVREFCGNFLADHQTHVFLRGRGIPFSEDDIRRYLGINIDHPPLGEDDMFKASVANRKRGELDMDLVFQVIGRQGMNWASNPADNTIPERKIDNAILNAQATAWHKMIIANIDTKKNSTTFDLDHATLIYVLMTEGIDTPPQAPPVQQEEQHPPLPSATSEIPSSSVQHPPEPSLRDIMRHLVRQDRLLRRQGRQLQNTQNMIRQAFLDTVFTGLL